MRRLCTSVSCCAEWLAIAAAYAEGRQVEAVGEARRLLDAGTTCRWSSVIARRMSEDGWQCVPQIKPEVRS